MAIVWCGCDCGRLARRRKSERESKETHTPPHFFYFLLIYFFYLLLICWVCFRLVCLLVFPFSILVGLLFVSLYLSLLCLCLVVPVYTCVYVCVLCGCVLSIYLCNLCYWLNNIMGLLSALKFFLPCSASRQLSRKTPKTVATFAGKILIDRDKINTFADV